MNDATDREIIALSSELGELSNAEIKDQFNDLWDAIGDKEDTAYTFQSYCEGFEHLCAGVLKLKNYSQVAVTDEYMDGLAEIFEKIRGKV